MACVRRRRGTWVLDHYLHGRRVVRAFETKALALAALAKLKAKRRAHLHPKVNPLVTLSEYSPRFLADCQEEAEVAPRTLQAYAAILDNHLLPRIGGLRVCDVTRPDIRSLLLTLHSQPVSVQGQKRGAREGRKGLSKTTISQHRAILSALFDCAIRDELREDNPARNVFRKARTKAAKARSRPRVGSTLKAMSTEERDRFLATALSVAPEWYTAWALMALAGLRRNEALGLRWESVRLAVRQIRVHEQLGSASTKSGDERTVDLAGPLADHLRRLRVRRMADALRQGGTLDERERVCIPDLSEEASRVDVERQVRRIARATRRVLKKADLPRHFTMHSLRHSFCSLLISSGVSPVYVQQQAGHADVGFTVRVYGSWFPATAPGAMDRLAGRVPGLPVTNQALPVTSAAGGSSEVLQPTGSTPRPGAGGPPSP